MYVLYSVLSVVALAIASPFLAYQAVRHRKYVRSLRQRLGYLPLSFNIDGDESIWIHAVSVGETLTARALIGELKARYPGLKLFLSTTTMTGHEVARALTDIDGVFYFPLDWGFTVRRTLDVVRPRLFVMMETEIWPMLLRECRERGVATMLVNGRVSKRSFARYALVRRFFRRVLDDVERFCMQSEEAARRIVALGADPARVIVTGSLKFDSLDWPGVGPHGQSRDRVLRYFRVSPGRPVVIAASTLRGEDQAGGVDPEHDGVGVEDPAEVAERGRPGSGAEVATDVVEGDVDDEEVEAGEKAGTDQDGRDRERVEGRSRRGGRDRQGSDRRAGDERASPSPFRDEW